MDWHRPVQGSNRTSTPLDTKNSKVSVTPRNGDYMDLVEGLHHWAKAEDMPGDTFGRNNGRAVVPKGQPQPLAFHINHYWVQVRRERTVMKEE